MLVRHNISPVSSNPAVEETARVVFLIVVELFLYLLVFVRRKIKNKIIAFCHGHIGLQLGWVRIYNIIYKLQIIDPPTAHKNMKAL